MRMRHPSDSRKAWKLTALKIIILLSIPLGLAAWIDAESTLVTPIDDGKRQATEIAIGKIVSAVQIYRLHTGSLPGQLEALQTDPGIEGWRGPYVRDLIDFYGDPYQYTIEDELFMVSSHAGGDEEGPIIKRVSLNVFEDASSP